MSDTFWESVGITADQMEQFYETASRLYTQGRYVEAADAYYFLSAIDSEIVAPWVALAMVEMQQQKWESARYYLIVALMIDLSDVQAHQLSAMCYEQLGDRESASRSRDLALYYQKNKM